MPNLKKNEDRAEEAQQTLDFFASTFNSDEDAITDLMTNLRHWCHREGRDFEAEVARSLLHFEAEQAEEGK